MTTKQVLIICDDAFIAHGISYHVRNKGFSVDTIRESRASLETCKCIMPSLILIHYSPFGDPPDELTICRRIREEVSFQKVPFF